MSHTKIQLWTIYVEKNPHWENDNITLTPAGLKKFFDQAYEKGYEHGQSVGAATEKLKNRAKPKSGVDYNDVFGDLFK